jgi:hypothetical protein
VGHRVPGIFDKTAANYQTTVIDSLPLADIASRERADVDHTEAIDIAECVISSTVRIASGMIGASTNIASGVYSEPQAGYRDLQ